MRRGGISRDRGEAGHCKSSSEGCREERRHPAEKHLGLGGGKEQSSSAGTAAQRQSERSSSIFILLQVGEASTRNPAFW